MGDWNRSLLLVVLWSWRSRTLRELKVQNCWFIYLLCEQEANKLRGKYRKFKWLRVFVNVCAMFRKETQAMVYTGWQDHAWAVLEVAMELWSPVSVTTRTDSKRNLVMPMIWGALLFDCLRCILVFLIFIVLGLNIAPIFKRTPVWFFLKKFGSRDNICQFLNLIHP